MADRDLIVHFIGDDRDLNRAFDRQGRNVTGFQRQMGTVTRLFAAAGVALGAREVLRGINASVDAASDLNEQVSKSREVFGTASNEIEAWAETTARAFGISQREALAATGTFGNLFKVVDLAPQQAAEMSQALVELAADLASFNNANPEDVLTALRSGLIGEAEPLRRYGVLLSEARVQQVALAETGKDSVKALTDQEKALARFEIILQDTATAQGNFAKTSGELANQSRILSAELEDASAKLGGLFVPFVESATRNAILGLRGFNALADAISGLAESTPVASQNLDQLIDRLETLDNISFLEGQQKEVDGLNERLLQIRDSLAKAGQLGSLVAAFRQGSDAIDQALEDGVIDRIEQATLRATELGQAFLLVVPKALTLGPAMRSAVEEGTGQAVDAARKGGEETGDAFVQGLQAASARISGQIAGLSEQVLRARIARDTDAEIAALRAQEASLRKQLATQEQIERRGGAGAPTARKKIRQEILPDLAGVLNEIDSVLAERDRQVKDAQRKATETSRRTSKAAQDLIDSTRLDLERAADRRRGRQFEALGLTPEGDERVPGVGALRRRLGNLEDQIKGTALDTESTRRKLRRIAAVLSGEFGKVGRDVRRAILSMLNEISSALEGRSSSGSGDGPLTRTSGLDTAKVLAGLGLTPEQIRELRGRLSSTNTAGGTLGEFAKGGFTSQGLTDRGTGGAIVVESHTTINLDGDQVARVVTRNQQKQRSRNPRQKRGPNRGGR